MNKAFHFKKWLWLVIAISLFFAMYYFYNTPIENTQYRKTKENTTQKNQLNKDLKEVKGESTQNKIEMITRENDIGKKNFMIESLFNSKDIIGKTKEIYDVLIRENDPVIIKALSKLLMLSFDNNTDVNGILTSLINNDLTSHSIIDYIPEYLSANEIGLLYKTNIDLISDEKKKSLLTYYINNSLINGEDPFLDQYMKSEYEKKKSELSISAIQTVSIALNMGENNSDYIKMQKQNFSTKMLLREKPKNMPEDLLYMWFKANLLISSDEVDKQIFINSISKELTNKEKESINSMLPNTFQTIN